MPHDAQLDWSDIRESAAKFVLEFKDAKRENADKQVFWHEFFKIFGLTARHLGEFEAFVKAKSTGKGWADYLWPGKLIIEHKSRGENLDDAFLQALDYINGLDTRDWPRYIIISDFERIILRDVEDSSNIDSIEIRLEDLVEHIDVFGFLAGYNDTKIVGQHPVNIKAAEKMGELYDFLKESNYNPDYLDKYLIRIVFCLFAEDSGLFERNLFNRYIAAHTSDDGTDTGSAIDTIFQLLDTPKENRQTNLSDELKKFPYVNGGLFKEHLPVAYYNRDMKNCIMECAKLNWEEISPAIFGSLFQCVMDADLRHLMGAHYTSEENILKVINPLFMDDLRAQFKKYRNDKNALGELAKKVASIKILDPACGCGNFLIIAFRELRNLEMDIYAELYGEKAVNRAPRVTIDNFYGIELLSFPAQIAEVAMLLMEHIMTLDRMKRFGKYDSIIPLKKAVTIIRGNSLMKDWTEIINPKDLSYIIGNPPYLGARNMKAGSDQKRDMETLFKKDAGTLDYVAAWFYKASTYMATNRKVKTAFLSTNSICQGEQVKPLWKPLIDRGIKINFAYRTFKWSNEARANAGVSIVIIGFSFETTQCHIYTHSEGVRGEPVKKYAKHINAYLVDSQDIFLDNRNTPLCDVPMIGIGNKPIDDGNYLFTEDEMKEFIKEEPESEKYFKRWLGAKEFINNEKRYCLWLGDCLPSELRSMPKCMERVAAVRQFRLDSRSKPTQKLADTPTRFHVENIPTSDYLLIPRHSSENREYIPLGFVHPDVLSGDANLVMNDCTLYHFGIMTSMMHMVWMRYVCGRLESRYRYSAGIVYNNYPWPDPSEKIREEISTKAQAVLDARAKYEGQSLADLYDPVTMPIELRKAHESLDAAVEKAYRPEPFKDDEERIQFLFDKYIKLVVGSNTDLKGY